MQLSTISPGKRFTLPRPTGSADALLLARFARQQLAALLENRPAGIRGVAHPLFQCTEPIDQCQHRRPVFAETF